jgi:hypothetical protein
MKHTIVKISEITSHPTKRMDAKYWIKRKEEKIMKNNRQKFFDNLAAWMKSSRVTSEPKVTQTDLGNELNVAFQQVQKYEKPSNEINLWNFIKCCDYFKEDYSAIINACKTTGYLRVKASVPMCKDEEYRNAGITEDQGQPKK